MFQRLLILFITSLFIACSDGSSANNKGGGTPIIEFYQKEFDFGTIQMGEKVTHDFLFKNIGDGDLYINKVVSDCGCTIVNYKRDAIVPGEQSSIEVVFDSNGLPGFQMKKIIVHSNAGDSAVLIVSAAVDYELDKGFN